MLTVRPCRPEELTAILECGVRTAVAQLVARDLPGATADGVRNQLCRMYQNALLVPDATVLVADWPPGVKGEGPAAYALLMPQPNAFTGEREVVILDIYTAPALRGHQVGRTLLSHAATYARSVGARSCVAQIAVHNAASRAMFQRAGFADERVVVGRRV
jgi:ribosomal protein S18 acetylase RimI-like enzyme